VGKKRIFSKIKMLAVGDYVNAAKTAKNTTTVKWSAEIEKVVFFHHSDKVTSLDKQNTLSIQDTKTLQGSISSSLPCWRLAENLKFESKLKLQSMHIIYQNLFMMVSVPNYSYEKQVSLIYTLDDWKTVLTAKGKYYSSPDHHNDLFQISIPLDKLLPFAQSLSFCIKYTHGSNQTVYENNFNQNHKISLYISSRFLTPSIRRKQKRQRKRLVSLTMATGLGSKHWSLSNIPPAKNMLNSYEMQCFSYTY
jgi:hypothetical protein